MDTQKKRQEEEQKKREADQQKKREAEEQHRTYMEGLDKKIKDAETELNGSGIRMRYNTMPVEEEVHHHFVLDHFRGSGIRKVPTEREIQIYVNNGYLPRNFINGFEELVTEYLTEKNSIKKEIERKSGSSYSDIREDSKIYSDIITKIDSIVNFFQTNVWSRKKTHDYERNHSLFLNDFKHLYELAKKAEDRRKVLFSTHTGLSRLGTFDTLSSIISEMFDFVEAYRPAVISNFSR